ncbi:MAG TPA: hypothetical protein VHF22_05975, partial [Planctomycetota bacterium]|nr:hypothetical protein [Planctomycetota bacterium]
MAVIACFFGATTLAQRQVRNIDEAARDIYANAMPSIEHLAATRFELRHLEVVADRVLLRAEAGTKAPLDEVDELIARIQREVRTYLDLPVFPGEREHWDDVEVGLAAILRATARLKAFTAAGDLRGGRAAFAELGRASDAANAAIQRSEEFNAQEGMRLAREIQDIRGRASGIAFAFDAVSGALALIALVVILGAVRSYTRLLDEHTRVLEERASELDAFAGRVAHDILGPLTAASASL